MSKRQGFRPDGLDVLEGRLAPAAIGGAPVPPPAEVDQQGDFQGQYGDQTTVDTTANTANTADAADAPDASDGD